MSIDQLPPADSGPDDDDRRVDAWSINYHMLRIMTEEDANDKSGGAVPGTHGNDAPIAGSDSCSRRPDTRWPGGQPNDRNSSDPAYCGSPNPKRPLKEQRDINSRCGAAAKAALGGDESTKDARIEAALRMIRGETGEEGGAVAASTDDEDGPSQPPLF